MIKHKHMITSLDLESRAIILVSPATICPFNRCLYFLIAISINISNTGIDFNSPVLQKQRLLMILLITATITDSIGTPMFLLIVQQLLSKSSSHCSGKDVYLCTPRFICTSSHLGYQAKQSEDYHSVKHLQHVSSDTQFHL